MNEDPIADQPPASSPSSGAERSAPACWCGAPLPPRRATGQPPRNCSVRCRRRRDHLRRKVRRREEWIRLWEEPSVRLAYTAEEICYELTQLRSEIGALLCALNGGAADENVETDGTLSQPTTEHHTIDDEQRATRS